jgi:hypothetical protein
MAERGFVAMARDDIEETMNRWHEILESHKSLIGPAMAAPIDFQEMIGRLLGDHIMLLRAIEEVEARPWWRRRRHNAH